MSPEQLDHFRRKLLEERQELDRRILAAEEEARRVVDPLDVTEDRAASSEAAEDSLRIGTMYTLRQHEIDEALLRIETGDYGVCEECGKPIELERLEANPVARLCEEDARRTDRRHPPKL